MPELFTPCSCLHHQSEGRVPASTDCLYYSPYLYALKRKHAGEATAEEFREYVREWEHDAGVTPVTAKAWYSFQGITA